LLWGARTLHEYEAKLVAIVDADTLKLDVDLGFHTWLRATFRLARINAPELMTLDGVQAKAFVIEQLNQATAIRIVSSRSEKYGRWLCELSFQTKASQWQWTNLNNLLLEFGHAVKFKH
jgi:endonuclease YncB( thermonuclease family)